MITLSILFILAGFFCCYNTSTRAAFKRNYSFQQYLLKNSRRANLLGLALMVLGLVFCIIGLGWGAGIFSFLVILSTIASLVILLNPLGLFFLPSFSFLLLVSFIIELYLF